MKKHIPAALLELKKRFEHWRNTRTGNPRIPEELLNVAVGLSLKHGITLVSRELGLNHVALKTHRQKIQNSSAAQQSSAKTTTLIGKDLSGLQNRFIELTPVHKQDNAISSSSAQVFCELEGLKICLKSPGASDWNNLFSGFLSATRLAQAAL